MKGGKLYFISLFLFILIPTQSQTGFDISAYRQFLSNNQNMSTSQLLQMYSAGSFTENINSDWQNALYADSITQKYQLTNYELQLLEQHGFVVTERLNNTNFGFQFLDIYHRDMTVFISTDAILHAFHFSYDRILRDVELGILIDRLETLLSNLSSVQSQLDANYSSQPEMLPYLKDLDVYLTVPRVLLNESGNPFYGSNQSRVDSLLTYIETEQFQEIKFFSASLRKIDFSQFKPRGHYDTEEYPQLARYFKAMMWLGRIELYLIAPRAFNPPPPKDVQRQVIISTLFKELVDLSNTKSIYEEMDDIIKFFVGEQDNVTLPNLEFVLQNINVTTASQLIDTLKFTEFQDTLRNQSFAFQLIMSQLLESDPMSPDSIIPASSFMPFGQRFIMDSYVTGSVVFDRITYLNQKIPRMLPSTLDILFALGNDASAQLLQSELNAFHYSANLAALRYLVDNYDQNFWKLSLYNFWLNGIRKLNPPADRSSYPPFMQTAAWWQQKMNTQLSSWTELRHDNLLYAKQSYTGIPVCSFPYSYVEPFPALYQNLSLLSDFAHTKFQTLSFSDPYRRNSVLEYFSHLKGVCDTLESISQKELSGTPFSPNEIYFLERMLYDQVVGYNNPPYDGWYPKLYYSYDDLQVGTQENDGFIEKDYLTADYHTSPADETGTIVGWVAHAGTGPVDMAIMSAVMPDGEHVAFIGPVMSYFEYTTTNFLRLTDTEWEETYLALAERPDWVNLYLANSSGASRGPGTNLITGITDKDGATVPKTHLLAQNYPNPFNASTIIAFSVPRNLTNSLTELNVYDIKGEKIQTLLRDILPAGNYMTNWNGKNEKGIDAASGIYFYELKVGTERYIGKMNLLK